MSPEQIKEAMEKMKGMSEEDLRRGASAARTQAAGTSTYLVNGAKQLKEEGNRLVSEGKWRDAREKYERAISNLLGMTSAEASLLRVQCTLNNALCFLKTADFGACIQGRQIEIVFVMLDARDVKLSLTGPTNLALQNVTAC